MMAMHMEEKQCNRHHPLCAIQNCSNSYCTKPAFVLIIYRGLGKRKKFLEDPNRGICWREQLQSPGKEYRTSSIDV